MTLKDIRIIFELLDQYQYKLIEEYYRAANNDTEDSAAATLLVIGVNTISRKEVESMMIFLDNVLKLAVAHHEGKLVEYICHDDLYDSPQEWLKNKNCSELNDIYHNIYEEVEYIEKFSHPKMSNPLRHSLKMLPKINKVTSWKMEGEEVSSTVWDHKIQRITREILEHYDTFVIKIKTLAETKSSMQEFYNLIMFGDYEIDNPIEPIEMLYHTATWTHGPIILQDGNQI